MYKVKVDVNAVKEARRRRLAQKEALKNKNKTHHTQDEGKMDVLLGKVKLPPKEEWLKPHKPPTKVRGAGDVTGFRSSSDSEDDEVYNRLKPDDPDKLVDVDPPEEGGNYEFSVAQVAEFRKVFDSFDRNGDESIGVEELGSVLRALGYSPSESDIEKVLSRFDADASGDLSFEEYLALMAVWVEEDETQILEAFKVFDKSGDGFVTIAELKRALCRFGEKFTEDEAEEFFELIDANRDGIINYEEFVKYMLSELNRGPPPRAVT